MHNTSSPGMPSVSIHGKVELFPGIGGWHYVLVPSDSVQELCVLAAKRGNIPLVVRLGNAVWKSTLMSMGNQQWFIAIKSPIRTAESISVGDNVTLQLTPDTDRIK